MRRPILYLMLTCLWLLSSCGRGPQEELEIRINKAIRSGNSVDEKECEDISAFIRSNAKELPDFVDDRNEPDNEKLTAYILEFARRRKDQPEPQIACASGEKLPATLPAIKFFIENSASMDGYVRGVQDFELTIGRLLVLAKNYSDNNNFDIYFINKKSYPAPEVKELSDFARTLEPDKNSPYNQGDRSESILNEVLKTVLDSTDRNTVSLLVSDCIYSLNPTKDTKGSLGYQKNGTMEAFLNKLEHTKDYPLTTAVYQFTSDFEGKYFPYNYEPSRKNSIYLQASRPYYIWIIGEDGHVRRFTEKLKIREQKGFRNSYLLSNFSEQRTPFYTVMRETGLKGSFRQADEERGRKEIHSIENVEYEKGIFQFSIAVDLSDIPVDASYLLHPRNYRAEGFSVVSVEKANRDKLKPNEWRRLEETPARYLITVATTSGQALRPLTLELLNAVPAWVESSTSTDDTNVQSETGKTFGLSYLIDGVEEAYSNVSGKNSYFKITVNINK